MRVVLSALALVTAGCVPVPPPETAGEVAGEVPPAPAGQAAVQWPERVLRGPGELQVRFYLEDVVSDRFGRDAWEQFLAARAGIAVTSLPGRWATSHVPSVNLLMRDRSGWSGRRGGAEAPVPAEVARELDRLLANAALWAEPSQHPEYVCPDSGAEVVLIRHSGRTRTVYQSAGCGTPNLSSRLISTALREQLAQ